MDNLKEIVIDSLSALKPPERLMVSEAAEKYRKINNPGSYVGGWDNKVAPYMVEPMNETLSKQYDSVIFVGSARSGKTDSLIVNKILHTVICDPCDMIVYQTSISTARSFSKKTIDKLHRDSPDIGRMLKVGARYDNTHDKQYKNGASVEISWPTLNEMSGKTARYCLLPDYDRMDLNIEGRGSPFDLAKTRTLTFGSSGCTIAESSPDHPISNLSYVPQHKHEAPPAPGIFELYNRGDRRRWYWPCPSCHEYFEPSFSLLKWVDSDDPIECGESAQMMCPHCASLFDHSLKFELNNCAHYLKQGESISKAGIITGEPLYTGIASFWAKGVVAAFSDWKRLVSKYVIANKSFEVTGDEQPVRTTVNVDQAEPYIPRGDKLDILPETYKQRAEVFAEDCIAVPPESRCLIACVDVQKNKFVVQVHAVVAPPNDGMIFDCVVVDRFDIKKSSRVDDDGDALLVKPSVYIEDWSLITELVINKKYPVFGCKGLTASIKFTCCDSGGADGVTAMAYNYYSNLKSQGMANRFILVKGHSRSSSPRVIVKYPDNHIKGVSPSVSGQVPVLMMNSNKLKSYATSMLAREGGGGCVRFSSALPDKFYNELTVEVFSNGKWTNPKRMPNEAFDLLYYFYAVCFYLSIDMVRFNECENWLLRFDSGNALVFKDDEDCELTSNIASDDELDKVKSLGGLFSGFR